MHPLEVLGGPGAKDGGGLSVRDGVHAVDIPVPGDPCRQLSRLPREHVERARRDVRGRRGLGHEQRAQRMRRMRHRHHRVSRAQGRQHERQEPKQRVPLRRRVHRHAHAARLGHAEVVVRAGHRVAAPHHHLVLVAPACPAHRAVDGHRHLGLGLLARGAGRRADRVGKVRAPAFEHLRQPVDDLPPKVGRRTAPRRERRARRLDGIAQVLAARVREVRHQRAVVAGERQRPPALRARVRALHEELPGLEHGDAVGVCHRWVRRQSAR